MRTKFKVLSLIAPGFAAAAAFELFCTPQERARKRDHTIFKYADILTEMHDGRKIHGYRWNKGKPVKVMILHGFASAAHRFHHYVAPLVEKGYEVLAFDAPAHGGSEGRSVNALQYSQMIEAMVKKYGPVKGFIAHSFGGLALSLALENIRHDESTRVVLIAPATETSTAADIAFRMLRIQNKKVRTEFDAIIFAKSGRQTSWFSVNRAIKNIKASVLWIHDEDDDVTPLDDALKTRDQQLPNVQFAITQGLGHRKIYRDSKIKKQVVDFL